MKKVKIISLLLALAMAFSLCACSSEETTEQKESVQFGTFGYNGAVLTDYAVSVYQEPSYFMAPAAAL